MTCDFISRSTVFQSYQLYAMKPIHSWENFASSWANPGPLDQQASV